jgi:hypothetical protein
MKKEKLLILSFAAILFACKVNSQNLYLNVGIGYAFPAASEVIGVNSSSASDENVYGSYGKGFNFGAGIGYMFNEHIGAELGFSYLLGSTYDVKDHAVLFSWKGKMFRIMPALKITGGESLKPYAKFGFVFGLDAEVKAEISGMVGNNTVVSGTETFSGGSSTGLLGALGIDFKGGGNLSFFAELAAIVQSWKPDKFESIVTSSNGNVSITDVNSRILVDNHPSGASGQMLVVVQPFSSIGINAGIRLAFGGTK